MFNLKAERRDQTIKAKKLRGKGIIPASIYGRNLDESILIQIPMADVNRFLSSVSKGSTLTVEVEDKKYNVLFKNITRETIRQHIEQIEFQHVVADEPVNSVISVVLINKDKTQCLVQQLVEEIPYSALPKHLIPEVIIDLDGMRAGTTVKIEDLDIAKNENIKIALPEDTALITVTEKKMAVLAEATEEETAEQEA